VLVAVRGSWLLLSPMWCAVVVVSNPRNILFF
jgi:hypothetical protein